MEIFMRGSCMTLMKWTREDYGTDVEQFDGQHQELFDRVNALNAAVSSNERPEIGVRLDRLIEYVVKHFQDEEIQMQAKGYADLARHQEEHAALVNTCADLQTKFHANEAEIGADTMGFIKAWLDNHIPVIDRKYGPALNG
jgi:hemerythrin